MRIIVHDMVGHPFQVQLSRELARRGHHVLHLHFPAFQTAKGQLDRLPSDPSTFEISGIKSDRPFLKYNLLRRRFQEIGYGHLAVKRMMAFRPDVILSSNTPLDAQNVIQRAAIAHGCRFVFWVQDLYSPAIRNVLNQKRFPFASLLANWYQRLERELMRKSDAVVCITSDFVQVMKEWGLDTSHAQTIENWAPLNEVTPFGQDNDWSRRQGIAGKFCFLYSGTLGLKHNPELLVALAESMRDIPDTVIVVISEGLGAEWLRDRLTTKPLTNVKILDYQPWSEFSQVLSSAHVLLALLGSDAGQFAVPSKVLTSMCVGRPLLLSVPLCNLAARIVSQNGAGIAVEPDNLEHFVSAARLLKADPALQQKYGQAARRYAEEHFDISRIAQRFEAIFVKLQ